MMSPATPDAPAQNVTVRDVLAEHMRRLAAGRTFGQAVVELVDEPELPFLARVAASKAVRAVVAQWDEAGRPQDVETLRTLFPEAVARSRRCTCDYVGLEDERHRDFCECEHGEPWHLCDDRSCRFAESQP